MKDELGRYITGTIPEDEAEAREAERHRGLGDSIEHLAKVTGMKRLAEFYTSLTGKDCGCRGRREKLNQLFPYEKT